MEKLKSRFEFSAAAGTDSEQPYSGFCSVAYTDEPICSHCSPSELYKNV